MQIGELSSRSGLSVTTLRYYESVGVLPAPARTAGGYRDYDEASLSRLEFVRAGRAVGLTLAEIRDIVACRERGLPPCAQVIGVLARHAVEVDRKISELRRRKHDIDRLARRARDLDPADCAESVVCHVLVVPPVGR